MNNDRNPGIDWDGELQALMEASGIDPSYAQRPPWKTRVWHRIRNARSVFYAIAATLAVMWWAAHSGAPAAATGPLCVWLTGWIGYWIWIGFGRPDWAAILTMTKDLSVRGFRASTRFIFRHTRPARARWRAWKVARNRERATRDAATTPTIA
ncbi:hypothetical protein [Nocardia sp. NPDC050406]|uniref:hypothetical protein n=1 Tax=Nocardia sp. NPDC050406 TaxID=3364318 RepID=UPI0037BC312A